MKDWSCINRPNWHCFFFVFFLKASLRLSWVVVVRSCEWFMIHLFFFVCFFLLEALKNAPASSWNSQVNWSSLPRCQMIDPLHCANTQWWWKKYVEDLQLYLFSFCYIGLMLDTSPSSEIDAHQHRLGVDWRITDSQTGPSHLCHSLAAKNSKQSGWLGEVFSRVLRFHATWTSTKATSCAIVLNWFVKPGLSWSFDSYWAFWSSFGLNWSSECKSLLAMLLIQSSYSLDYHLQIVLWTEAKHYLSTYAAQRWLDVFGVTAQNGPCLKCLNCDDLFECTKCCPFFCVGHSLLFSCFCHRGIFFCSHWHYSVFCKHYHLIFMFVAYVQ